MIEHPNLIALAAGGTGGHVFPASALAAEMTQRGWQVVFITDRRGGAVGGMEDVPTYRVRAGGVAGKSILGRLRSIPELIIGTFQARSILKRLSPDVVMGFGGYASVPTMMAATRSNCRTAIHEQNAVLGRANRLFARKVDKIAMSYAVCRSVPAEAESKIVQTGMPVRPEIAAVKDEAYPALGGDGPINLLVIGGSQGARVLSDVVPAAVAQLPDGIRTRLNVVQQCREEDLDRVRDAYGSMNISATVSRFFDDMPRQLVSSHLVITRAGASSVAEVLAVGRPSILVPYPHAVDDHQSANAHAVAEVGAGWMMDQSIFTVEHLSSRLSELLSGAALPRTAECARRTGFPDAASRLADMVETLVPTNGNHEGRAAA